jgi:formylglycine-generating enzyme required for sulfatase activity
MAAALSLLVVGIVAGLAWANRHYVAARTVMLAEAIWSPALTAANERLLNTGQSFRECADCPTMIVVREGKFVMGSPPEESQYTNERPQHTVTLAAPFAVSKFEVSFDEWDACALLGGCTITPWDEAWEERGRRPVIHVNWEDAQQYVSWLAKRTRKPYRLLSEAEWEYAARAGNQGFYTWGDDIPEGKANCNRCGSPWDYKLTAPVDSFPPNAFGLSAMHGNVSEWVQDCYEVYTNEPRDAAPRDAKNCRLRITRGGHWLNLRDELRSARRVSMPPDSRRNFIGIRVGRSLLR